MRVGHLWKGLLRFSFQAGDVPESENPHGQNHRLVGSEGSGTPQYPCAA